MTPTSKIPESEGERPRLRGLDGIRGIAIGLVLLFHGRVFGLGEPTEVSHAVYRAAVSVGWIGVDLFFVLSGFLISGILVDRRLAPRYFTNFYARRTLRIFPLYYGFLLVVPLVVRLWTGNPLWDGMLSAFTYTTNFLVTFGGGWEELALPMQHFWSLAVEEQFYLVWPLVIWLVAPKRLFAVAVGLILIAPFIRLLFFSVDLPQGAYTLTVARMDSLAVGAAIALLARRPHGLRPLRPYAAVAFVTCVGAIAAVAAWRRGFYSWDVVAGVAGMSLVAVAGGSLLILVLTSSTRSALIRTLEHRSLATLGLYSYAVYVFHQPVYLSLVAMGLSVPALGGGFFGEIAFLALGGSVSFLGAAISWRILEKPFLGLKRHFA